MWRLGSRSASVLARCTTHAHHSGASTVNGLHTTLTPAAGHHNRVNITTATITHNHLMMVPPCLPKSHQTQARAATGSSCGHGASETKSKTPSCHATAHGTEKGPTCGGGGPSPAPLSEFSWTHVPMWRRAGINTSWCLLGCSIGEFGTLGAYGMLGVEASDGMGSLGYYTLLALPLVNGLLTSVALETALLARGPDGLPFKQALETAVGMSFISMLVMEVAMEATDLWFTGGSLTVAPAAMPLMLAAGWLAPLPYNYHRLAKYGKACH
eukprot:m.225056 g.225056  ORF g.225056 m.225056 type:complete len:269 (+) comp34739_c0_seq1:82-888(+)